MTIVRTTVVLDGPDGYVIRPGARLAVWYRDISAWVVYFNGRDLVIPFENAVVVSEEAAERRLFVHSAARLEQYQLAPSKG